MLDEHDTGKPRRGRLTKATAAAAAALMAGGITAAVAVPAPAQHGPAGQRRGRAGCSEQRCRDHGSREPEAPVRVVPGPRVPAWAVGPAWILHADHQLIS